MHGPKNGPGHHAQGHVEPHQDPTHHEQQAPLGHDLEPGRSSVRLLVDGHRHPCSLRETVGRSGSYATNLRLRNCRVELPVLQPFGSWSVTDHDHLTNTGGHVGAFGGSPPLRPPRSGRTSSPSRGPAQCLSPGSPRGRHRSQDRVPQPPPGVAGDAVNCLQQVPHRGTSSKPTRNRSSALGRILGGSADACSMAATAGVDSPWSARAHGATRALRTAVQCTPSGLETKTDGRI